MTEFIKSKDGTWINLNYVSMFEIYQREDTSLCDIQIRLGDNALCFHWLEYGFKSEEEAQQYLDSEMRKYNARIS